MTHHHFLDTERPTTDRWTPRAEHEVLAAARDRILALDIDRDGNVHRGDVLDALTPDDA